MVWCGLGERSRLDDVLPPQPLHQGRRWLEGFILIVGIRRQAGPVRDCKETAACASPRPHGALVGEGEGMKGGACHLNDDFAAKPSDKSGHWLKSEWMG